MAFLVKDNDENAFFKEISTLSDRVVGLLAPIVIDNRLTSAIQSRWLDAPTPGGTIFGELFRDGGEIGDFGTRVRIGFAMGLFGPNAFNDLRNIMKIRNAFAHHLSVTDFKTQPVIDLVGNLKLMEKYPPPSDLLIDKAAITGDLWDVLLGTTSVADLTEPRNIFLRTTELLISLLLREEQDLNQKPHTPRF